VNDALAPWLQRAFERAQTVPAHALLLHGAGVLGQLDLGLALARSALCESPTDRQACGRCSGCHLFDQRAHPDFQLLIPDALRERLGWAPVEEGGVDKKTKPSRDIKVDAVRRGIDWSQQTSSRGRAKQWLIHPAEAMNETAANALLKTLEEPPGRLRLLLTASDVEALLPTVRSRCQRVAIERPSSDEAVAWLRGQGVDTHPERLLAAAGGLPQAALALHQDGIDAAAWMQVPALVRAAQAGPLAGWPVARVVEALHKLCHDLMVTQAGGSPCYFAPEALGGLLRPALPSAEALAGWEAELRRAARHDEHPWHAALRVEALVAQAAALWQTARGEASARGRPLDTLPGR
jgi:DNA polymerase III subunit delta'